MKERMTHYVQYVHNLLFITETKKKTLNPKLFLRSLKHILDLSIFKKQHFSLNRVNFVCGQN